MIRAKKHGVTADGTDQTAAVQSVFDMAASDGEGVTFPAGVIGLSATVVLRELDGLRVCGEGTTATVFRWLPDSPGDVVFEMSNCRSNHISDFMLDCDVGAVFGTGFRSRCDEGSLVPHHNIFDCVTVARGNGTYYIGWHIDDSGERGDVNNENFTFRDCQALAYDQEGWLLEGYNNKAHWFFNCTFNADSSGGQHGVRLVKGTFHWRGGVGGGNTVADFHLTYATESISLEGFSIENSAKLLAVASSGAPWGVTVRDGRWSSDEGRLSADNMIIQSLVQGPLIVEGNSFYVAGDLKGAGRNNHQLTAGVNTANTRPSIRFSRNICRWTGSADGNVFNFVGPAGTLMEIDVRGNVWYGDGLDDQVVPYAFPENENEPQVAQCNAYATGNGGLEWPGNIDRLKGGWRGKSLRIYIEDDKTRFRFATSTNLIGNGGEDWIGKPGDWMDVAFDSDTVARCSIHEA